MQTVLSVYKPLGHTPLQTIHLLKEKHPGYKYEKISYAGRLDPMAEGLLLLLVGEENKKRKEYENLQKTYEFTLLLGVQTDTYDILGKVVHLPLKKMENGTWKMENLLQSFMGKRMQPYPPYSSKTVNGKPLYWWARQNRLHEIVIPEKEIEITHLSLTSQETITKDALQQIILERINKVQGNFRQEEVLQIWKDFFNAKYTCIPGSSRQTFPLLHCRVTCSSGTYVRRIAHEIGGKLGCGGIALNIKRTHVGKFQLASATYL